MSGKTSKIANRVGECRTAYQGPVAGSSSTKARMSRSIRTTSSSRPGAFGVVVSGHHDAHVRALVDTIVRHGGSEGDSRGRIRKSKPYKVRLQSEAKLAAFTISYVVEKTDRKGARGITQSYDRAKSWRSAQKSANSQAVRGAADRVQTAAR
jgi:hypothetical protein